MTADTQTEEPPERAEPKGRVFLGIALKGDSIEVAARAGGREVARGRFPAGSIGTEALQGYLLDWQGPLRLAVAHTGMAALALALALGGQPGREVFLIASHSDRAVSDLARYAERAI
jgi:hypothetical protein